MEVSLEVLLSTSIKRKNPCPRLSWLGQEKEAVFVVDEKNVGKINLRSGRVKKTLLKQSSVVALATSVNGAWLAALHLTGKLTLWNKDLDCLQTVPANGEISQVIGLAQENSLKLYLYVSGEGSRVLLATHTGCVYLWENTEEKNQPVSQKTRILTGRWTKIQPRDTVVFPSTTDKEATVHAIFVKNEVLGDSCLCTFVFCSGTRLVMTFLALCWHEHNQKFNSVVPYHVHWAQQDCSLDTIALTCEPVKSRGALLAVFSKNGLVLAMVINQKDPKATCVLFMNTMNFVTVFSSLRGCSSRDQQIPSRLLRSYWVGDMAWTADSLFLACMLKRGSLLLLTHTGELLTLTTSGCSVEFGPAEFIPLHPLITYRTSVPILESRDANDSLGSMASEADLLRQMFSVTCHPRLPYLIVSDGYMVTVLRFTQNLSPYYFMKSLLLDSAQRLENVRQNLQLVKSKKNGFKLRSLSSLKATLLKDPRNPPSVVSTIPRFLQDEEEICGRLEKLMTQDDDEESDDQDYAKYTAPTDGTFGRAEHGRLEFASMFDTIHASDHYMEKSDVLSNLLHIQRTLLTAWAVGVTMSNVAETNALLHYTVGCLTHFLYILQSPKCPNLKTGKLSKRTAEGSPWAAYIAIFQQCLTVLYWDVAPRQATGHMIKLTAETIKLILVQHQQLYSKSLLESYCLLKTVSQHLDAIYSLQFESTALTSAMGNVADLDSLKTPLFQAITQPPKVFPMHFVFKEPPKPVIHNAKSEKRLAVLWRLLYNQTLWYQTRLRKQISASQSMQLAPEVQSEEKAIGFLLCHIQAELQSAGEHFNQSFRLLPVNGEEYYLLGSYKESVEFWNRELVETTTRGGRRAGILQTRFYLAVLYCYLYSYNLNDAQGMCDQLVKEMLIRSSLLTETEQEIHAGPGAGQQPFEKVRAEAALAVIQSMGRFMAAYFTNQLLYVFPPHNVRVLAPLHITTDRFPRVITLQHSVVASVVREQNLSSVWTVEYALDLLLVGGLILEAAWLANKLGDWKMSVSMAVAYNLHRETIPDESKGEVPPMPLYLSPAHTFQEKLQSFLGQPPNSETSNKGHTEQKQFTDPIEEEDADVLFSSVQEMLKAAVMTDAEILTETLHQLMESAKDLSRKLSGLVPERLYLPAPPLYCPQPSSVSEEDPSDFLLVAEKGNRQKLSGVLQRILLLLRAARCSLPAAQWYIKQIKRARKIMQKIRAKGSLPLNKALPDTLLNYANSRTVFLKAGASGNLINNLVSSSVIACFRELCALCWMLHVREQLSISCRKYQKTRDNGKLFKSSDEYDSCVTEHCFEALEWACRMLPFTRVTNCEELIQDIVLSLISELPPVRKVAEIMVKAFPRPDDVRVPLREKYHSVQQRLRHSMIKGLQGEEMMSVVIHNVQRVRVKTLRRMQKNIGPLEMHVWEPALDETLENELRSYDKYSLCTTSLSRSTLTDLGRPQIYSDTDTLSDGLMCTATDERTEWHIPLDRAVKRNKATGEKVREKSEMPSESGPSVPKVGTWEFECDDEEYTSFLELFLSYLLEKDLLHSSEPGIPFLTAFSQHLQEHELNSLVFDVHTTLKRKLGRPGIKSVFRAGSCYKVNTETHSDSVNMEGPLLHTHGPTEPSPALCSTVVIEKPVPSTERYFHNLRSRRSVKSGLFGLQDQRTQKISEEKHNFSLSSLPSDHTSDMYSYRLIQNKHFAPSEELGAELQAKYINEAKLVEWMIRWSDRRLFWSTGKTECHVASSTAIRVKTSSAAILTSIWLLEKPYLGSDYIHNVPPREYIIAPVIQDVANSKLQGGPSVDHLDSERGSLSTVHEQDHESEEEIVSIASSKVSRKSCERSQGRQHFIQDSSDDDTSVLCEHTTVVQIPIPSETEDDKEDQLETERIPKISVSIHPVPQQMQILSIDSEHHAQDPEEPIVQEIRESPQRNEPAASASLGSPLPQSFSNAAAACPPPASSANQPESVTDGGQNTQPGNTSEAFRQLFQDEMFRLLQLQQMNFIGLMQVVGSSFAALPAMQHMLQQTSQIERNPMSNPTGGQSAPQGHASTVSGSHTSQVADVVQASTRCHDSGAGKAPHDQSNKENLQSLPELSIATNKVNDGGKIPANLGLLSTTHSQGLPLITPPPVLQKTPTLISPPRFSSLNGFPLLKLRTEPGFIQPRAEHFSRPNYGPPLREAWGPSNSAQRTTNSQPSDRVTQPPCYTGLSNTGIRIVKKAEDTKKWADIVIKGLSKHSTAYSSNSHTGTRAHQQSLKTKDRREKPEIDLFGTPQNNVGIPLLHLRTDPVLYIPTIPVPNFRGPMVPPLSKDKSDLSKITPQAALTLLKSDLPKQIQSLHIGSTPRLLPLENLIAFERDAAHRGDPGTAEGSVQLLKANIQPFEEVVKAGDSMKRQKRRTLQEKGDKKEKKTTVTFRPEDSIIKPNNFDEVVKTENEHHGKQGLEEGNEFIIPLGTFESVLSDQIPDTPLPSAAELHYMAATKKRAPDIRDASTNTDSASRSLKNTGTECEEFPSNRSAAGHPAPGASESPKPLKDTGTECEEIFSSRMASSRPAAESLLSDMHHEMPPKLFLNVRFRDDHQPEMTPTLQNSSPPTEVGHLSRLDIDSEEFLRQFPDSTDQNVPSSAELHLMAASVADVLPPELFNRREILSVDMLERPQLQERASSRTDSVTQRLLSINPSPGPKVLTPHALESNEAFSRLKEMDVQLRALQNMAESMERDFANTELLVNTIENLATVIDPDPGDTHSSGVAGRPERVLPVSDIALEELAEEDEFTLPSPAVISSHGRPLEVFISARSDKRPSTAPSQDRNMDKSTINEALQVTGLSDIADILSDLMAGGVSASELGLTQTQAENISRERLRNTSRRTQKEKAELQLWMKSKRRERLAEHRRKLEVLREQEHSPFQSQKTANTSISSKTIRQSQRVKDERDRTLLSEHHTYRVSDAIGLMQDMLSEAKQIPSANPKPRISEASLSKHQGPHLAHKGSRTAMRSLSAGQAEKRRSASKAALPQPRSMSTPAWTQPRGTASFVPPKSNWEPKIKTHRVPSYSAHRKYDPSLPGDRMSQITRRGMLAGRNRTNVPSKSTKQILKTSARPLTSPRQDHKGTSPQSPHRSFPLEEAYERDSVSPWEIPDEINRILNSSRNSIQSQRSLLNGDDISHNLHLDNSSDSTGSILSKLDWKAIEDMVTSVGST